MEIDAIGGVAPKMSLWHIDYSEVKLLEKQPMRERHSDPPLCPPQSNDNSPM